MNDDLVDLAGQHGRRSRGPGMNDFGARQNFLRIMQLEDVANRERKEIKYNYTK
jgi:hypothetical protein